MEKHFYAFTPAQPEMKSNCEVYMESRRQGALKNGVSLFYQFKMDEHSSGMLPIIPDGCLDLLFSCDPTKPFALVATSPEQRSNYFFDNYEYFGVRLYPEQRCLKLKCSIKELLQEQQLPIMDVLHIDASVIEIMANLSSFEERVKWFELFLFEKRNDHVDFHQNLLTHCLNKIYITNGFLNFKQLSLETGYSDRYIRKIFDEHIGFSPKKFSQIVRFQHSVYALLDNSLGINNIIWDDGFYDEAHFYKGFKKYTTLTPKQFKESLKLKSI